MAKALDNFDRIVCINLDERADRWEQMQQTTGPLLGNTRINRFSAVKPRLAKDGVHNGRAGCLLSHRRVIESAYEDGVESVLAFEDDVRFDPRFEELAQTTMASLQKTQWDVFYLGFTPKAPLLPAGDGLVQTLGGITTHAIAYHRRAMPELLRRLPDESRVLRFLSRYKSIDRYYWQHAAPAMRFYAASPLLAFQRDDFSDIQQNQTTSNEQESKQAFAKELREGEGTAQHLGIRTSLAINRLRYAIDGTRRAILKPIKAK